MEANCIRCKGIELDELRDACGCSRPCLDDCGDHRGLIAKKVAGDNRGAGILNGLDIGVLVMHWMLPLHLMYGPRHQTGSSPFVLGELIILAMVALVWFVILDLFRHGAQTLVQAQRYAEALWSRDCVP